MLGANLKRYEKSVRHTISCYFNERRDGISDPQILEGSR